MKKIAIFFLAFLMSACSTEYILMDENNNPVGEDYYTEGYGQDVMTEDDLIASSAADRLLTTNDVFVVSEGEDTVTYQYKNVRVDEISPLASLYCADMAIDASPYLREVSMYHNGFMRATFDCVTLAI